MKAMSKKMVAELLLAVYHIVDSVCDSTMCEKCPLRRTCDGVLQDADREGVKTPGLV